MTITKNDELIINIGDHTQCLDKDFVKKAIEAQLVKEGRVGAPSCAKHYREDSDSIVDRVKEKLSSRSEVGIKKYGTTIWTNTDENYLQHLQEELLDGANYCEQQMRLGVFSQDVATLVESEPNDTSLGEKIRILYNNLLKK